MNDRMNGFFVWVWRINGLLFLAIGLAGLVGIAALMVNVGIFASRESPTDGIAEVAGTRIEDSDLNFGPFRQVKGIDVFYAELGTASKYIGSGSSSTVANVRNMLFFDTKSRTSHWLLDDNATQIHRSWFLTDPPDCFHADEHRESCEAQRKAVALLLETGPPRSEKRPSPASHEVLIATPDGRQLAPLLKDVDAVLGTETVSGGSTFVFYSRSGSVRVAQLEPTTRKLVTDEALQADR
ncbi:hypothetical protein [Endothiovibrio diazotrophicus]